MALTAALGPAGCAGDGTGPASPPADVDVDGLRCPAGDQVLRRSAAIGLPAPEEAAVAEARFATPEGSLASFLAASYPGLDPDRFRRTGATGGDEVRFVYQRDAALRAVAVVVRAGPEWVVNTFVACSSELG